MNFKFKKVKLTKRLLAAMAASLAVILLIFAWSFHINTLPPAQSGEHVYIQSINSSSEIFENITYAPKKIADFIIIEVFNPESVTFFRVLSVAVAAASVLSFFFLVWQCISHRIAIMATLLFATSSWIFFAARSSEPTVLLLLGVPILILAGMLLRIKEYDPYLPLTSLGVMISLFIPGFWLFLLIGLIFSAKDIYEAFSEASAKLKVIWLGTTVPLFGLLIYGLANGSFTSWFGGSNVTISSILENIRQLPSQLFISGLDDASYWLPGTPILDIVTSAFFAIGLFYVTRDSRFPVRRIVLLAFLATSVSMIALFGSSYIGLLLPLIYIFVAFGITFLLEQWFHIFPKNPIARGIGLTIIIILISITSFYHIYRYHHVWPRSHVANHIFQTK